MRKIFTPMRLEVGGLLALAAGLRLWSGQGWLRIALNVIVLLWCVWSAWPCYANLRYSFRMMFDQEFRRKEERLDAICAGFAAMGDHVQQAYGAVIDGDSERLQGLAAEFDKKFLDNETLVGIDGTDRGLRLVSGDR